MKYRKYILIILFIILLGSLILISCNMHNKFKMFKEHREYFDMPLNNRSIESWMTLRMIYEEFGINVPFTLGQNDKFLDHKLTLEEYVKKKNLNLTEIINQLESNVSLQNVENKK